MEKLVKTYRNQNREALLDRMDFGTREQGGHFVFFHSNNHATAKAFRKRLQSHLPDTQILGETPYEDHNVLIIHTDQEPEDFLEQWQEKANEQFKYEKPKKEEKKKDIVQIRGAVGILAQISMILSGMYDPDKTTGKKAKFQTSAINFFGYGLNWTYGVQKEMDHTRLGFAKDLVNKNIGLRHTEQKELLPKPSSTKRTIEAEDAPGWMERNSVKFTSAVKLMAKFPGLQTKKETEENDVGKIIEKPRDEAQFISSVLSITGKLITLFGLPEDPFNLEKDQSSIAKVRRQSNLVSSMLDWVSTISLAVGVFFKPLPKENQADRKWWEVFNLKNQRPRAKDKRQLWQGAAVILFVTGLILKALSPFTNKRLDTDNLMSHATQALANGVNRGHVEELTKLTSQMMQTREMPEMHKLGFAHVWSNIANRIEGVHSIEMHQLPQKKQLKAEAASDSKEIEAGPSKEAKQPDIADTEREEEQPEERPTLASQIANEKREDTLVDRLSALDAKSLETSVASTL